MASDRLPDKDFALLKFLLYLGFFVAGILTVLVGQVLPILFARLSLTDERAGYFIAAQFSGSVTGVLTSRPIVERIGFTGILLIGFAFMAVGILVLNSGAYPVCLAAIFLHGVGIGFTIPAINMLIAELSPQKTSAALNFLNFFWGVGAISCKPFVDSFGTRTSFLTPTLMLVGAILLIAPAIVFAPRPNEQKRRPEAAGGGLESLPPIWTTATAWLIAIFNFLYVGLESGVGGWLTTYEARLLNSDGNSWLSAVSVFFLFLVVGRLSATVFLGFLKENTFLLWSLLTATLGVVLVLLAQDFRLLLAGAAIGGFGMSAVFPTNTARFTGIFGESSTRRATPLFVCGSLGGGFVSWLVGYVSTNLDDLRGGMLVLLAAAVALIALQTVLMFRTRKA